MADTVDVKVLRNPLSQGGRHYVVRCTNESDGTGESGVAKIDISALTLGSVNAAPTYCTIDRIVGHVSGFNYVVLRWDHTTDDEIAVLRGNFDLDWTDVGGQTDPKTSGGTGDVLLTTDGAFDGASYDITIYTRMHP